MTSQMPTINSRWRIPNHRELSGVEYRVLEQFDCNGYPYFKLENCTAGNRFSVELAWFTRRAQEIGGAK